VSSWLPNTPQISFPHWGLRSPSQHLWPWWSLPQMSMAAHQPLHPVGMSAQRSLAVHFYILISYDRDGTKCPIKILWQNEWMNNLRRSKWIFLPMKASPENVDYTFYLCLTLHSKTKDSDNMFTYVTDWKGICTKSNFPASLECVCIAVNISDSRGNNTNKSNLFPGYFSHDQTYFLKRWGTSWAHF
jgi:hypothetical protein